MGVGSGVTDDNDWCSDGGVTEVSVNSLLCAGLYVRPDYGTEECDWSGFRW